MTPAPSNEQFRGSPLTPEMIEALERFWWARYEVRFSGCSLADALEQGTPAWPGAPEPRIRRVLDALTGNNDAR